MVFDLGAEVVAYTPAGQSARVEAGQLSEVVTETLAEVSDIVVKMLAAELARSRRIPVFLVRLLQIQRHGSNGLVAVDLRSSKYDMTCEIYVTT